jgi:acyl carrier protein
VSEVIEASALRGYVRDAWEEALSARVADDADFFDLGGNSMAAISISGHLEGALRVRPKLRAIFDNPRFADYVDEISKIVREAP